jgi:Ca2+-binding RTX toxin-like protein
VGNSIKSLVAWAVAGTFLGAAAIHQMNAPAAASHCPSQTVGGTAGEDFLVSSDDRASTLNGLGSADHMRGYDCNDTLNGGDGPDNAHGATGADLVYGNDGHENSGHCNSFFTFCGELVGGGDGDRIEGNAGSDTLDDTSGSDTDTAVGGVDNDTVKVNDGDNNDLASGGSGTDTCNSDVASEEDSSCES